MKTGKMISFVALAVIMMTFSASSAGARGTALGVIVGEPTGFSGKLWTSSKTAFAAGLAWSLDNNAGMHIHVDYLWHKTAKLKRNRGSLPWYYGIGGRLKTNNNKNSDDFLGVRFPVGLEFFLEDTPLDLFIEIVPVFDIAPKSELDFNAAIGARIVF
ncbi:hypothetical protein JYT16_02070 [Gemmatimonas aurantiaca]|nr:hypothetical protein [Gemmatimonas aurantiaca]